MLAAIICNGMDEPFKKKISSSSSDLDIDFYNDLSEFYEVGKEHSFIVFAFRDNNQQNRLLCDSISVRKKHPLKPTYILKAVDNEADGFYVVDGIFSSLEDIVSHQSQINGLLLTLNKENETEIDQDAKLLKFLFSRPDFIVAPEKDWTCRKLYKYPLLSAFVDEGVDVVRWIQTLADRDLIEKVDLIDRVRDCPACGSSHLSFIDICPNCSSIDIENVPFIHCFTCGNVEPQEKFMRAESLICPRCNSRLRHIGADYDRPLENYQCHNCSHIFEEPNVVAKCAECGKVSEPEDLIAREVFSFKISRQGRLAAQHGDSSEIIQILDKINYAKFSYFKFILNWLVAMNRRMPETTFSIVGLNLENIVDLVNSIGRGKTTVLMHGFAEQLRELVRTTDICSRSSETHFWMLLPQTDAKGCEKFIARLNEIKEKTIQDSGEELLFNLEVFSSDQSLGESGSSEGYSAETIIAEMSSGLRE